MSRKTTLFDAAGIAAGIEKMAREIIAEFAGSAPDYVLVGVYKQGVPLAGRLRAAIRQLSGYTPETGLLDISMYRDDIGLRSGLPLIRETCIPFDLDRSRVIIVDDILTTGRTIRAALDALTDYGRPDLIRLAVLVDRGRPEFPIRADYVGIHVDFPDEVKVRLELEENEGRDRLYRE